MCFVIMYCGYIEVTGGGLRSKMCDTVKKDR